MSILLFNLSLSVRFWQGRLFKGLGLLQVNREWVDVNSSKKFFEGQPFLMEYGFSYDRAIFLEDISFAVKNDFVCNNNISFLNLFYVSENIDGKLSNMLVLFDVSKSNNITCYYDFSREIFWFKDDFFTQMFLKEIFFDNSGKSFIASNTSTRSNKLVLLDYKVGVDHSFVGFESTITDKLLTSNWTLSDYRSTLRVDSYKNSGVTFWNEKKVAKRLNALSKNSVYSDSYLWVSLFFEKLPMVDDDFLADEVADEDLDEDASLLEEAGKQEVIWSKPSKAFERNIENISERALFDRSMRFVGTSDAWGFVDVNSKVDIVNPNVFLNRAAFYSDLRVEKQRRMAMKELFVDFDVFLSNPSSLRVSDQGFWSLTERGSYKHVFFDKDHKTMFYNLDGDFGHSMDFNENVMGPFQDLTQYNKDQVFTRPYRSDHFNLE